MAKKMPKIKTEKKDDDNEVVVMEISDNDDKDDVVRDEITSDNVAKQQEGENRTDGDDEEDEIVREIPVFLSPKLSNEIQLVQFPLQQHKFTSEPEAVRVKPRHCMMEIDIPTPSNIEFQGLYHMPSRTFASQTIPVSTHMCVGKMIDGGLHLIPLSRMMQMRPNFSHIDEAALASMSTTEDELRQRQKQEAAGASDRQSIRFRKKESERAELARKSSYGYKKASEDAEGWHTLEVYDEASLQAKLLMGKVPCPSEHQSRDLLDVKTLENEVQSSMNKKIPGTSLNANYLNTLNYLPPRDDLVDDATTTNLGKSDGNGDGTSDRQAELVPVVKKLVRLMQQGRPIPFSLLRAEFPRPSKSGGRSTGVSDTTLTVALGSCAVLVRGNWCLNSRLLSYPPAMTQARTFLLCLFQSMRVVHRERLMRVFAQDNKDAMQTKRSSDDDENDGELVTPEVIEMLLEQLGEKTSEGWVLKVDDDRNFAEQHPQTTLVHLQYWAKQIDLFRPMIEKYSV